MKKICFFLALACCLLVTSFAQAKSHTPAKSQKAPAAVPGDGSSDTVEVPGKVIKEPNAFHGIKWGTAMAAVPDLTVVEKSGQATYASVDGVVYRIGEVFLTNVIYNFCQDRFAAVMVEYKGRKAHESIRNFLAGKYSKPVDVKGSGDDLGWPLGNVLIRMAFSPVTDTGTLSYFYQPLYVPCVDQGEKAPQ